MDRRDLQPQTDYAGPSCQLPPEPNLQALNQVISSSLDAADGGHFGLQAQSVFLLDRLLFVMRLTGSNKETKLAELADLDCKTRSFLETLTGELEWRQTLNCVHVALCHRYASCTASLDGG